jgi:NmrA-like family
MAASPALPIIAVCGATGKQGGGVINSLLKDAPDTFAIRAITRDEKSAKAQALRDRGIEVVSADFDSVSSLQKAFSGAHGGAGPPRKRPSMKPPSRPQQRNKFLLFSLVQLSVSPTSGSTSMPNARPARLQR